MNIKKFLNTRNFKYMVYYTLTLPRYLVVWCLKYTCTVLVQSWGEFVAALRLFGLFLLTATTCCFKYLQNWQVHENNLESSCMSLYHEKSTIGWQIPSLYNNYWLIVIVPSYSYGSFWVCQNPNLNSLEREQRPLCDREGPFWREYYHHWKECVTVHRQVCSVCVCVNGYVDMLYLRFNYLLCSLCSHRLTWLRTKLQCRISLIYRGSRLYNMIARTPNIWIVQNLKNGKLYDSLPFIFECFIPYNTLSSVKKHRESTEPQIARWPKCFEKICRVELCTELFYAIIPTLFPCFLLTCYPYILLII